MIRNIICVSDLHCGCQFGLCPEKGITLDGGGHYEPSKNQKVVWQWWKLFWHTWVPEFTKGEPYIIVINGDTTDGRHHNSVTQVSQNLADQKHIAEEVLSPLTEKAAALYMIRGTEAHVGPSAENEEMLAESLGAKQNSVGNNTHYELWLKIGGKTGCLVNFMHHIGTTGSSHYESSAVNKELSEMFQEAGRWGNQPPDVVIRSHRHRHFKVECSTSRGYGICEVTPGWQLKTPFVYKIPGGRISTPQFGGIMIRQGDREHYTVSKVWNITRPEAIIL